VAAEHEDVLSTVEKETYAKVCVCVNNPFLLAFTWNKDQTTPCA